MTAKKQDDAAVEPLLYSIEQTCARLGNLSRTKIYGEMAAGDLEYIQIGDRRFTTAEQQLAYIARKQVKTSAAA